jgi:hypothetical protein
MTHNAIAMNAVLQDVPGEDVALARSIVNTGNDAVISLEGLWITR